MSLIDRLRNDIQAGRREARELVDRARNIPVHSIVEALDRFAAKHGDAPLTDFLKSLQEMDDREVHSIVSELEDDALAWIERRFLKAVAKAETKKPAASASKAK